MPSFAARTLTLNPSIDVSSEADRVEPAKKIRTCCERIDPGGGGINVARVLHRLGIEVEALYLAGGVTGSALDGLLEREGLARRCVAIADDTRTSLAVHERATGDDYRFVPEGPTVDAAELGACLKAVESANCAYFVASGSLPPGVPDDFYASVGRIARHGGARFILDTSGAELGAAVTAGGIFVLKASNEELDESAARGLVADGRTDQVALTLGSAGALLITRDGSFRLPAVEVEPVSTVGAGDSFLAGMTCGLARGLPLLEAFRLAVAVAAATTLAPGTQLAQRDVVERLLAKVPAPAQI